MPVGGFRENAFKVMTLFIFNNSMQRRPKIKLHFVVSFVAIMKYIITCCTDDTKTVQRMKPAKIK